MSKHPYPDHIRDAVADAIESLFMEADTWEKIDAAHDNLADTALQALWDASLVETNEQLEQLPDHSFIVDEGGCCISETPNYVNTSYLPAHVIHWGGADE